MYICSGRTVAKPPRIPAILLSDPGGPWVSISIKHNHLAIACSFSTPPVDFVELVWLHRLTRCNLNSAEVLKIEHPVRGDDTRAWGPPFAEYSEGGKEGPGESAYYLAVS